MKTVVAIVCIFLNLGAIKAGYNGNCGIEGIDDYDWGSWGGWKFDSKLKDDQEGVIRSFKTENILELTEVESDFLNATYENNVLTVFTNERFKNFEEEFEGDGWYGNYIEIEMSFKCSDKKNDFLMMEIEVEDVNNHSPVLSCAVYEYNFGTSIPEDFDLTKFLPINATDVDFTNEDLYFTIEQNEFIRLGYNGKKESKTYRTTLRALKEIRAPFRREFTLVATDSGNPTRSSSATLRVNVVSQGDDSGSLVHPPVFSKHLYFANYTLSGDLLFTEEPIFKYGAQEDTVITQNGFEEFFQVQYDPMTHYVQVNQARSPPKSVQDENNPMVIEIEAENPGLSIPGRTALVISFPFSANSNGNGGQSSNDCSVTYMLNDNYIFSLVIYLCMIFIVVVMNIAVLAWYFQKRSLISPIAPATYAFNDVLTQEKTKI